MPDGGVMGATTYIDGRPAAIEYLRPDFRPGTPADHSSIRVRFLDDNSSLIALRDDSPPALDALARSILSDRAAAARRRLVMDAVWNEGAHPRGQPDNKGQFAKKGEAIAGAVPEAPAAPKAKKAKAPKVAKPKTKKVAPTEAPAPTPPPVSTGQEPPPFPNHPLTPPAGFVVEYDGQTIKSYKDLAGHVLNIMSEGDWSIFPDDQPSEAGPVAKGTTQQDLEAAISKHFGGAPAAEPKSAPPTDHATFSFNTPETQEALNKMPPEAQANATALSWAGYTAHPHNLGIDFVKGSHQIELFSDGSFSIDDKGGQPLEQGNKADELPAKLKSVLDEWPHLGDMPQFKTGKTAPTAAMPVAPAAQPAPPKTPGMPDLPPHAHIAETIDQSDTGAEYKLATGEHLALENNGDWSLFETNAGGLVENGNGQAALNATFEKLHPRGEGGKFVKKNAKGEFELSGLTPDGDEPSQFNSAWGMGDNGHRFWWGGDDGEHLQASVIIGTGENANKWRVFSRSGGSVQGEGLDGLIAAIQNTAEIPKPGVGEAGSVAHGPAPYDGPVAPPSDWGAPYAKTSSAWSYQSGTTYLDIYPDGTWAISPETNPLVSGKGQADLDAAILKHVPESIVQGAAAGPVEHGPPPFSDSPLAPPAGLIKTGESKMAAYYTMPGSRKLKIIPGGGWELWQGVTMLEGGDSQEQLDAAVQKVMGSGGTPAPAAAPVKQVTPSPSVGSIGAPITLSGMTKLGSNKGSNPGGTYQDKDGKKYYVKLLKDEDHVRNELLAAKLYQLTGAPTLDYHPVADNPNGISTDWQQLDSDNLSGLTPAQRDKAKLDFAAHAWLSNWDAVGLTGDNIGALLENQGGGHINLDVGGSLAYRAQGEPKGAKFGVTVPEWDTLRDPGVNANSAALFGDMTTDQLAASVKQVAKVTDEQILKAAEDAGYKASELAQMVYKLTKRRDDVIQRAKTEIANKQIAEATSQAANTPPSGETWATPRQTDFSSWDKEYHTRLKAAPRATKKEANAIRLYTGGDYRPWNKALRDSQGRDAGNFQQYTPVLDAFLDRASFPKDTTLTRIVNTNFAKYLLGEYRSSLKPGAKEFGPYQFNDDGFISTDDWSGPLVMKIKVPKGAKAAAVGYHSENPQENEIMLARGSRFQIDDVDANGVMHMTLVRSGRAENGIWHPIKGAAPVAAMPVTPKAPTAAATDHLTFAKGSPLPAPTVNGKKFESWKPPIDPTDWRYVTGTNSGLAMPSLPDTKKKRSSGIVMLEPDGRVWLVKPTNGFGGYNYTFPKGGVEPGLDTRANAIKETYEESGLKGNITGFVGDYEGDTSMTRYFLGERETGSPLDHGDESEAVVLVPLAEAAQYLNNERDLKILADVIASQAAAPLKKAA